MAETGDSEARERGGAVLSVRFTSEELDRLKAEAEQAGEPVSAYVRKFALARHQIGQYVHMKPSNVATSPSALAGAQIAGYVGTYSGELGTNF
jgi:hypothetical protein